MLLSTVSFNNDDESKRIHKKKILMIGSPWISISDKNDITSSSRSPISSKAEVCRRRKDSNSAFIPGIKEASDRSCSHWWTAHHVVSTQNKESDFAIQWRSFFCEKLKSSFSVNGVYEFVHVVEISLKTAQTESKYESKPELLLWQAPLPKNHGLTLEQPVETKNRGQSS